MKKAKKVMLFSQDICICNLYKNRNRRLVIVTRRRFFLLDQYLESPSIL